MRDWDERYSKSETRLFGDAPNEYVREVMARSDFNPRTALCLGDGDGRNGLWLAQRGLTVTGVDLSRIATEQALEHDRSHGVEVERVVADLAEWQPDPARTWDAVFMVYLQCESAVRHRAMRMAISALPPGGWFVIEGFARAGMTEDGPGPKESDLLYYLDDFLPLFPDFRIAEALEGRIWLNEGTKHCGDAHIVRLLAQRL
jgi:SAM-dependent methyltransferase